MAQATKTQVALCIAELLAGGAEKALAELALGLDRSRFAPRVYVLRSRRFHENRASYIPVLDRGGVPVHFLDVGGPASLPGALLRLRRGLLGKDSNGEPGADIFLSFMFHANILGRLAARLAGIPVILSGIRVSEREHHSHLLLDRLTSGLVRRYVCVSQSVADFTANRGNIPATKITVIPNAVSDTPLPAEFLGSIIGNGTENKGGNCGDAQSLDSRPVPVPLPPREPGETRIAFAGRLVWQKGLDWLLETAEVWLGAEWSARTTLTLFGDGPLKEDLDQAVSRLPAGLGSRIRFAGWRQGIPAILREFDLFLLPSRYEGMPNVLLEASLAGLPILSARCDGAEEILGNGSEDQTFGFGDLCEFTHKLRAILESEPLRKSLGAANRRRALGEFSVAAMVSRYEKLFDEELDKPAGHR